MQKETLIRTALLVLALTNQILSSMGKSILPFDDEIISQLISAIFTVCASIWAWWKNNSFTPAAIKADKLLKELRKNGN